MFWDLLKKEFLIELRSKEISASMLTFGVAVILIFSFSFSVSPRTMNTFAPGLFWVMTLFIAVLGLHRIYAYEKEFDAFGFLISAPVDRGLIFLSKWVSGTLFLLVADLFIAPPFYLFLQLSARPDPGMNFLILLLGNLGLMVLGSLVSGLAMRAKMSEVLLPILLFPLASPVMIAATKATAALWSGIPFRDWQIWILILLTIIISFGLVGFLVFDHITEE
ncbi:MAG: hypothetical protein D6762_05675 [Candidatus Neomarinimicrobiota bacterium]|nr:MAG: hypothetical protein D6762_05675 [Candidatus Neomarinimicrobiota bacterium]